MPRLLGDELGVNMSLVNHWVFGDRVAEGMGRARGLGTASWGIGPERPAQTPIVAEPLGGGNCSRPERGRGAKRCNVWGARVGYQRNGSRRGGGGGGCCPYIWSYLEKKGAVA